MFFEKTGLKDIDEVVKIMTDARARIGNLGIDQWQRGYPDRSVIEEDIRLDRSYVARDEDGSLCTVFAVIDDGEPTYNTIYEGAWITDGDDYLAVHRIAVSPLKLRRGVASLAMQYVEAMAAEMGRKSVRIDTHLGNTPMRAMLESNGYVHCGSIYLETGEHRVAYEKRI